MYIEYSGKLRQKETSAYFTVPTSHIPPIPLSKLHLDLHHSTVSFQGVKYSCQALAYCGSFTVDKAFSFLALLIDHSKHHCLLVFRFSALHIIFQKSPFHLPPFATVFECVCGGWFSFSPLLHL